MSNKLEQINEYLKIGIVKKKKKTINDKAMTPVLKLSII